jgi:hypothetical protein
VISSQLPECSRKNWVNALINFERRSLPFCSTYQAVSMVRPVCVLQLSSRGMISIDGVCNLDSTGYLLCYKAKIYQVYDIIRPEVLFKDFPSEHRFDNPSYTLLFEFIYKLGKVCVPPFDETFFFFDDLIQCNMICPVFPIGSSKQTLYAKAFTSHGCPFVRAHMAEIASSSKI